MESKDLVRFLRLCHACNDLPTLDRALEILNGKRAWLQTKACNAQAMLHPLQAPTELVLKMKLLTNPRKGIPDASNN
jgi:hypothetical protein